MSSAPLPADLFGATRFGDDPLADWGNDDILFNEDSRRRLGLSFPDVLPVLVWDELCAAFREHEVLAGAAQRRSRRYGLVSVLIGALGLVTIAVTSAMPQSGHLSAMLRALAEVLLIAGTVLGFAHWLRGRSRMIWLGHRFLAERLRQFYFQCLLMNLPLAAAVIRDPAQTDEWHAWRRRQLTLFLDDHMYDVSGRMERMLNDRAEWDDWIGDSRGDPAAGLNSAHKPSLERLLAVLRRQRIGIQRDYVERKTRFSFSSPTWRARAVRDISNLLTIAVFVLGAATGLLLMLGGTTADLSVRIVLCASAVCSATILVLRVLDEGMQLRVDAERYEWYGAVIENVDERFRSGGLSAKAIALRDLERASYQEMRRFIKAHRDAQFML